MEHFKATTAPAKEDDLEREVQISDQKDDKQSLIDSVHNRSGKKHLHTRWKRGFRSIGRIPVNHKLVPIYRPSLE